MACTLRAVGFLLEVGLPAIPAAAQTCPWMNAATAGGVLGGDVTATVTPDACTFVRPGAELLIAVQPVVRKVDASHAATCGPDPAPLKAIGNEAVICTAGRTVRVVGRVRDKIFTITLTSAKPETFREKARAVAEQVAGNLF